MSAAAALASSQDRPAPIRAHANPVIEWKGVLFSMSAAAPMPAAGASTPEAVDVLRAYSAPRARIGGPDVPHGPARRMQAQMCASGLVPGRAWAPPGVAAWLGYGSAHEAMRAFARGLLGEVRAAGMASLRMVCRIQSAEVGGTFLDGRSAESWPALFAEPDAIGATHRVGAKIAAAGGMAGVLVEGGVVAVYRLDAIALRPLGSVYEVNVTVDGAAVARRIAMGKGYSS